MSTKNAQTQMLIDLLDQAFDRHSWHGTNLGGSIRGLTVRQAVWRPSPQRHNIWELVLHTAYWKYVVRRRLTGAPRGSFPRRPSDWPSVPYRATASAWTEDVVLLRAEHVALRDCVEDLPAARLGKVSPGSKYTPLQHIHGIAAHDLYHAGQIQLLKRLQRRR